MGKVNRPSKGKPGPYEKPKPAAKKQPAAAPTAEKPGPSKSTAKPASPSKSQSAASSPRAPPKNVSIVIKKIDTKDIESFKSSLQKKDSHQPTESRSASPSLSEASTEPCYSPDVNPGGEDSSDDTIQDSRRISPSLEEIITIDDIKAEEPERRESSLEAQMGSSSPSASPAKKVVGGKKNILPARASNRNHHPRRRPAIPQQRRAGISFPVGRIHRLLRKETPGARISRTAAVYTAAVFEYLTAEVVELAGNIAKEQKKKSIKPRHIFLAIKDDEEIESLLRHVTIPESGALPSTRGLLAFQGFEAFMKRYKRFS